MRIRSTQNPPKPFHDMSAMIDIVFLLLVFFMLTLQIALPEGSHEVQAQAGDVRGNDPLVLPEIRVHLESAPDGSLSTVTLNGRSTGEGEDGLTTLQKEVQHFCEVLGPENARQTSIVIETDYDLKYEHSVRALGMCSKRQTADGRLILLGPKVRMSTRGRNIAD